MFKNRSLMVKMVKDANVPTEESDEEFEHVLIVSDSVVNLVKEAGDAAVTLVTTYMVLDTIRKVCIALASK